MFLLAGKTDNEELLPQRLCQGGLQGLHPRLRVPLPQADLQRADDRPESRRQVVWILFSPSRGHRGGREPQGPGSQEEARPGLRQVRQEGQDGVQAGHGEGTQTRGQVCQMKKHNLENHNSLYYYYYDAIFTRKIK